MLTLPRCITLDMFEADGSECDGSVSIRVNRPALDNCGAHVQCHKVDQRIDLEQSSMIGPLPKGYMASVTVREKL